MEVAANYRGSLRLICLFKFILLAGDYLPPILFNPYLNRVQPAEAGKPRWLWRCRTDHLVGILLQLAVPVLSGTEPRFRDGL